MEVNKGGFMGTRNSRSKEFERQRRDLQLSTGKTYRTQIRYLMMLGRGWYMEKVRKGLVPLNPEVLERFNLDGDVK
jgi:hypothetical protein